MGEHFAGGEDFDEIKAKSGEVSGLLCQRCKGEAMTIVNFVPDCQGLFGLSGTASTVQPFNHGQKHTTYVEGGQPWEGGALQRCRHRADGLGGPGPPNGLRIRRARVKH